MPRSRVHNLLDASPHGLGIEIEHIADEIVGGLRPDAPLGQYLGRKVLPVPGHYELGAGFDRGGQDVSSGAGAGMPDIDKFREVYLGRK